MKGEALNCFLFFHHAVHKGRLPRVVRLGQREGVMNGGIGVKVTQRRSD